MYTSAVIDMNWVCRGMSGPLVCRADMPCRPKLADITMSGRHVADMSPTFPAKNSGIDSSISRWQFRGERSSSLSSLAGNVGDMSATCRPDTVMLANFCRHGMSGRHTRGPRHTQFISITADEYKSAQMYEYHSYHRVFCV